MNSHRSFVRDNWLLALVLWWQWWYWLLTLVSLCWLFWGGCGWENMRKLRLRKWVKYKHRAYSCPDLKKERHLKKERQQQEGKKKKHKIQVANRLSVCGWIWKVFFLPTGICTVIVLNYSSWVRMTFLVLGINEFESQLPKYFKWVPI